MPVLTIEDLENSTTSPDQSTMVPMGATASAVIAGTEKEKSIFTAQQEDSAKYAFRMMNQMQVIDDLMDSGFDPLNPRDQFVELAPFIPDLAENALVSSKYGILRDAARDFTMAQLRDESGAAIPVAEVEMAMELYVPRFGDDLARQQSKRERRQNAFNAMKASAGKAFDRTLRETKKSASPDLTSDEALDVLKERAKRNPELRAKLKAAGLL
tara:strand:+ start:7839 stop:8477 length:639 start_codon:yes stop_codon:yes gene_type:complete